MAESATCGSQSRKQWQELIYMTDSAAYESTFLKRWWEYIQMADSDSCGSTCRKRWFASPTWPRLLHVGYTHTCPEGGGVELASCQGSTCNQGCQELNLARIVACRYACIKVAEVEPSRRVACVPTSLKGCKLDAYNYCCIQFRMYQGGRVDLSRQESSCGPKSPNGWIFLSCCRPAH